MTHSNDRIVTVFGGSGFLGRHVVRALAKRGYRVRVAVRRPDLANFLQPLGDVGQIMPVQANLRNPESVVRAVDGAYGVVNLVGILFETGKQSFDAVHHQGVKTIAEATTEAGIDNLMQISAIGADKSSPSIYAQSKAKGEEAVLSAVANAVIIRPSLVIGPEDDFFNKFADMSRFAPALPLIGGGGTLFQPVFVGDVAEVVARGVDGKLEAGTIYELGGPEAKSFKALLEMMLKETRRKRFLVSLPFWTAGIIATFAQLMPKPALTRDQLRLLKKHNVVSDAAHAEGRTLEGLGIQPQAIEAVIGGYLWSYRETGQYEANRSR